MLEPKEQLTVLLAEYASVREELRMYIKEYSPKLTVFGSAFVAGCGWVAAQKSASSNEWAWASVALPPLVLLLGHVTIAQSYLVAMLGARSHAIEKEIADLNGGIPLMKWQHLYAEDFVFRPLLNLSGQHRFGWLSRLNPLHACVGVVIITGAIIVSITMISACVFLAEKSPWAAVFYAGLMVVFLLTQLVQSLAFFRYGQMADELYLTYNLRSGGSSGTK